MEYKVKTVEPERLMPALLELLEVTESVPLVVSGNSMNPFLAHGRDTVYLSNMKEPPRRGDMVLYRRHNGDYILHRVYRVEENEYTMVGDAQNWLETGIRRDQILAVVTAVCRKGKLLRKGCFWWDFFEKVWIRMVPLRRTVLALHTRLKKLVK